MPRKRRTRSSSTTMVLSNPAVKKMELVFWSQTVFKRNLTLLRKDKASDPSICAIPSLFGSQAIFKLSYLRQITQNETFEVFCALFTSSNPALHWHFKNEKLTILAIFKKSSALSSCSILLCCNLMIRRIRSIKILHRFLSNCQSC